MSSASAWILLALSGLIDVAWATSVKLSAGYSRLGWAAASFVLVILFIVMLGRALEVLPIGTAYVVWTGVGAVGSVAVGIVLFGESASLVRLVWIAVTVAGIAGLKMTNK